MSAEWPMKGGNDIKTEQSERETRNVKPKVHTNRGNEDKITIRNVANFNGEIIHELGDTAWCDQSNENDQAHVEEEEGTYGGLTLITMEIQGNINLPLRTFARKLSFSYCMEADFARERKRTSVGTILVLWYASKPEAQPLSQTLTDH